MFSRVIEIVLNKKKNNVTYENTQEQEIDKHEEFVKRIRVQGYSYAQLITKIKNKEIKISDLTDIELENLTKFYKNQRRVA